MSYSYLKNVFPDFAAVKSYNEPIYGIVKKSEKVIQPSPIDESQMAKYAQALINENKNALVSSDIENFANDSKHCEAHCDDYIKHILECAQCKETMMKHLKTDSDRIKNEEIMEIISFIAFGVFILLVMEHLKSN